VRRFAAVLAVSALAACSVSEAAQRPDPTGAVATGVTDAATARGASGVTVATGAAGPRLPDPEERVPLRAGPLARALETTWEARRDAIAAWTAGGGTATWPVPDDVVLLTLYEQRIYRSLAPRDRLRRAVLARLEGALASQARLVTAAGHALFEHFTPVRHVPDFRIRAPESADALLSYFREADERFDVAWQVLAAVMLVETRMGRIRSHSSAGAQGPMQFLPSTWDAYGLGGDVHDPHDAVIGAANFLRAMGAPGDYARALHAYNPVEAYVIAVRAYAKAMTRDPNAYYAFYNWQVFVRTTHGDVRLSGPGFPV
jgi:hypothetical protein